MNTGFRTALTCAIAATLASAQALAAEEADKVGALEEVVVTAQHVESTLSKTPIAMTAITGDALVEKGITDATRLGDATPNTMLVINNGLQITIRGVTSTDNTEKGDPSAGFLLDGVYIARPFDQTASFFDVERVEVLRGPQGTLYGKNTTAGAINVITARPKREFEAKVAGSFGSFGQTTDSFVLNAPVTDTFAIRAAVNYDRRESWLKSGPARTSSIPDPVDTKSARLSALWNVSDALTVFAKVDQSWLDGTGPGTVPLTNFFRPANPAAAYSTTNPPAYQNLSSDARRVYPSNDAWKYSADNWVRGLMTEVDWDIGPGTLTYVGSYRQSLRKEHGNLLLGVPAPVVRSTFDGKFYTNTHEVRYAFGSGQRVHGQVGGYFLHERSGIAFWIYDLIAPNTRFGFPQDPTINESKAGFGQLTFDATDAFRLTAGVRYSNEFKSRKGATALDAVSGTTPVSRIATLQINDASRQYTKLTWRVGAEYDTSLGMVYGTVSTGFKAGGFNDGCETGKGAGCALTAAGLYYNPEELTAVEGGFKFRLLDDRLALNGAVFHYDYKDLQVSQVANVCGGPCQVTQNAAKAKIDGVELELTLQATEHGRLTASANYLKARYEKYAPVNVDWSGVALDRSPKFTAAFGYTHEFPLSTGAAIEVGINERYSSKYVIRDATVPTLFTQPSYNKTDLLATYRAADDKWYVQGYLRNIEDELTLTTASTGFGGSAGFQEPRTAGVRAGFNFK